MTNEQKEKVMLMRRQCYSYSEIADSVGVAKNTIKSFCQRNDLGERYVQNVKEKGSNACPQCGGPVEQTSRTKPRRFCSESCRQSWWNANLGLVNRKAVYRYQCKYCGKPCGQSEKRGYRELSTSSWMYFEKKYRKMPILYG